MHFREKPTHHIMQLDVCLQPRLYIYSDHDTDMNLEEVRSETTVRLPRTSTLTRNEKRMETETGLATNLSVVFLSYDHCSRCNESV